MCTTNSSLRPMTVKKKIALCGVTWTLIGHRLQMITSMFDLHYVRWPNNIPKPHFCVYFLRGEELKFSIGPALTIR